MTYQQMAYVYDQFMADAPYDKWVTFAEEMFLKSSFNVKDIVDLGCGTGEITIKLAEKGYNLTGIDNSPEMLAIAEQKASNKQLQIDWFKQDLRLLEGLKNLDVAVSFCDVLNYITTRDEVKQVFQNVANLLREGGLFLFDVHSLYHVENNMVNQTFADVTDDQSYIWFCEEGKEKGEMYHDLTFFLKNGNCYERFAESHFQKTLSIDEYQNYLRAAGFQINGVYHDFSIQNDSRCQESERVFFFAEKRSG